MQRVVVGAALALCSAACAGHVTQAVAVLRPASGSQVTGTATFTERDDVTTVVIEARDLTPGLHGVHVHTRGDCSAPDASSAGDHFNPEGGTHGAPGHAHGHGGDLGNLEAGADGTGTLRMETDALTVSRGARAVLGRAVVVHASSDDLSSQPGGNAGARVACGVIEPAP
jgi:superoxide dismutase, Cu-Zn family